MAAIDLRLLRYFITVAEEGHLTRAAQKLGLQQPPLSQQIRALENELGVTLFRRLPRGMELTESGQALLAEARAVVARVTQMVDDVRLIANGRRGRIAVGFTESASLHPFVPAVIRAYRASTPDIAMTVVESSTPELVTALRERRVDAAFIRSPVGDAGGLLIEPVLAEDMVLAVPRSHALAQDARRREVALASLAQEPFIFNRRPTGPGLYDAIIAACNAAGFSPHVEQEAQKHLAALTLVAAGLGVSIVPGSLRHVALDDVRYLKLTGAGKLRAPLFLAVRDEEHSATVRQIMTLTRQCVKQGLGVSKEDVAESGCATKSGSVESWVLRKKAAL